ncbi:MAG TPA: hydrogenase maturation protease [Candidatus Paceibacterota bacterium]|nr:hydrogenase maturation protease [Verrucomicrobiota bacterium]HRZ43607.1 hydrogenase maturation protease [Candidatus Paceibacterota bacterium]
MGDWLSELAECFRGRVCLAGLGRLGGGDDAFGVCLAERLARLEARPGVRVLAAGTDLESCAHRLSAGRDDHVIFLDAVAAGQTPGTMIWMGGADLQNRFPAVSTHRLSLGLLARAIEDGGATCCWLLGVEPAALSLGAALSPVVAGVLEELYRWLEHRVARSPLHELPPLPAFGHPLPREPRGRGQGEGAFCGSGIQGENLRLANSRAAAKRFAAAGGPGVS